jgi:hypothetical protein
LLNEIERRVRRKGKQARDLVVFLFSAPLVATQNGGDGGDAGDANGDDDVGGNGGGGGGVRAYPHSHKQRRLQAAEQQLVHRACAQSPAPLRFLAAPATLAELKHCCEGGCQVRYKQAMHIIILVVPAVFLF